MTNEAWDIYIYLMEHKHVGKENAIRTNDLKERIGFLSGMTNKQVSNFLHKVKDELLAQRIAILGDGAGRYIAKDIYEIMDVRNRLKAEATKRFNTAQRYDDLIRLRKWGSK